MDGKGHGSRPSGDGQIRKKKRILSGVKSQRRILTFCKTHRSALLSGFLIVTLVALLVGIFAQLQSPAASDIPSGETSINYSTFLTQVNDGNVLAVTIRGNDINAFLQQPLTSHAQAALSSDQRASQIAAWTHYANSLNSGSLDTASSNLDPARMVYTLLPADGAAQLLPLLTRQHVTVITQAV